MVSVSSKEQQFNLDSLIEACRGNGLKITPQRLEICRELVTFDGHPSVEDIFDRLRQRMPTISVDTVYRTLATLQETGVLARVEILDDHGRFEVNREPHHHFVCVRCRSVQDFHWPDFDGMALPEEIGKLGKAERPYIEVRGICRTCLEKAERPKS